MTLTAPEPTRAHPGTHLAAASASLNAILNFISGLLSIPSVQRVAFFTEGVRVHLWVFQREENLDDARRIYGLADGLLYDADDIPLQLHVIPLNEINETSLPPLRTIVER